MHASMPTALSRGAFSGPLRAPSISASADLWSAMTSVAPSTPNSMFVDLPVRSNAPEKTRRRSAPLANIGVAIHIDYEHGQI